MEQEQQGMIWEAGRQEGIKQFWKAFNDKSMRSMLDFNISVAKHFAGGYVTEDFKEPEMATHCYIGGFREGWDQAKYLTV